MYNCNICFKLYNDIIKMTILEYWGAVAGLPRFTETHLEWGGEMTHPNSLQFAMFIIALLHTAFKGDSPAALNILLSAVF